MPNLHEVVHGRRAPLHPFIEEAKVQHSAFGGRDTILFRLSDGGFATITEGDLYRFLIEEGLIQFGPPPELLPETGF